MALFQLQVLHALRSHHQASHGLARAMTPPTPESSILRACLDILSVHRIWHMRMNTGAVKLERRFVRFSRPGTADILATVQIRLPLDSMRITLAVLWLECKSSIGRQSPAQRQFQLEVESSGHIYLLIRSPEDLITWLRAHSVIP